MLKHDYEIEKQEDEDLRCPICEFYFSEVIKPYLLPCNHNLCLGCIDRIINKNMLYCPMCRKPFSKEDRENFRVNIPFLNLVIKILKTKVIYCSKCLKIFNWTEHQSKCDQRQFKETNEIFEEIKLLAGDCIVFLENLDKTEKMKKENITTIINTIKKYGENFSKNFFKKSQEFIESFYHNIPKMDIDELSGEIVYFIRLCEPIYATLNLNVKEINDLIRNIKGGKEEIMNNFEETIRMDSSIFNLSKQLLNLENFPTFRPAKMHYKIKTQNNTEIEKKMKSITIINNNGNDDSDNDKNNYDKINYIISIFNHIKDTKQKILNYSQQVEFTTETIKSQIANNYNNYNELISLHLQSLYDSLIVQNYKNDEDEEIKVVFVDYFIDTKKIWLFDALTNKCNYIELDFLNNKFNSSFSISYDSKSNYVYITGGKIKQSLSLFSNETVYLDQCLIIPFKDKLRQSDITTIQIPHKKANHSSLFYNNKLFLIGGENDKGVYLRDCECYNTKDKIWELMPKMNYGRFNPSLCIYKSKFLYVFRGESESINKYFEFINIERFNCGWSVVEVQDIGQSFVTLKKSGASTISDRQIVICGGIENGKTENKIVGYSYIYDPIKKSVYRSKDLAKRAYFSHGGIYNKKGNKLYIIDEKNETGNSFGVHIYDLETHSWSFHL